MLAWQDETFLFHCSNHQAMSRYATCLKQELDQYHGLVGVAIPYPLPDEGWQGARLQCRLFLCQDTCACWPLCW